MSKLLWKIRIKWLRLMQQLRRLIWLRRSRCLIRLTEKQLKAMWEAEEIWKTTDPLNKMYLMDPISPLMMAKMEAPLNLTPTEENLVMMEDLQIASRQLTSMLTSKTS